MVSGRAEGHGTRLSLDRAAGNVLRREQGAVTLRTLSLRPRSHSDTSVPAPLDRAAISGKSRAVGSGGRPASAPPRFCRDAVTGTQRQRLHSPPLPHSQVTYSRHGTQVVGAGGKN